MELTVPDVATINIDYLKNNDEKSLDGYFDKQFLNSCIIILRKILGNTIDFKKVKSNSDTFMDDFISQAGEKTDIIFGNKKRFKEPNKTEFKNYCQNKKRIEYLKGGYCLWAIDSSRIYIDLVDISLKIKDYTVEEILKECTYNNGIYFYQSSVTDKRLPFEKEEIMDFYHKTKKKITIQVKVKFFIEGDDIGGGVDIEY